MEENLIEIKKQIARYILKICQEKGLKVNKVLGVLVPFKYECPYGYCYHVELLPNIKLDIVESCEIERYIKDTLGTEVDIEEYGRELIAESLADEGSKKIKDIFYSQEEKS